MWNALWPLLLPALMLQTYGSGAVVGDFQCRPGPIPSRNQAFDVKFTLADRFGAAGVFSHHLTMAD